MRGTGQGNGRQVSLPKDILIILDKLPDGNLF
jgi:hypothetical protein